MLCLPISTNHKHSLQKLPKDWVVIRLSSLGDIVLTTGPLEYWHKHYMWNFTVITLECNAPIFEYSPAVKKVIPLTKQQLTPLNLLPTLLSIAKKCSGYGLIDLHNTPKTFLLSLLWSGPTYSYPKMNIQRRIFLRTKGTFFKKQLQKYNVPQRYAKAIEAIPPEKSSLAPRITLRTEEIHKAQEMLAPLLSSKQPIVALHPYSLHKNKAWSMSSWKKLIQTLTAQQIPWFIIGRGDPIQDIPEQNDFTNKTTIRETCALIHTASVLITGDSGPMHLSTAVNTPTIALFGPTTKEWGFYPSGEQDIILETDISCRPCSLHGGKTCPISRPCMKNITHEQVIETLKKLTKNLNHTMEAPLKE